MYYLLSTEDSGILLSTEASKEVTMIHGLLIGKSTIIVYVLFTFYQRYNSGILLSLKTAQKSLYMDSRFVNQLLLYMYYLLSTKDSSILLSTEDSKKSHHT